jgi:hypothetical protein
MPELKNPKHEIFAVEKAAGADDEAAVWRGEAKPPARSSAIAPQRSPVGMRQLHLPLTSCFRRQENGA